MSSTLPVAGGGGPGTGLVPQARTGRLNAPAVGGRPPTVPGELARTRLVARLEERWRVPVLTVVGGAGFGKSIALAQAVRAHAVSPVGIEGWVSCRRAGDAGALVDAIAAALGTPDPSGSPGAPTTTEVSDPGPRLRALVTDLAPLDACLVLDDVEHLDDAPACLAVIADLLAAEPAHLHLVLAGRRLPALALARWRAAGLVASVAEDDLRFTDCEVAALGRSVGGPGGPGAHRDAPAALPDLAGWPALVRLALAAPRGAVREYLLEEVAAGLAPMDRRALLTLVTLGGAGAGTVVAITGDAFDADGFAARVPLVAVDGDTVVAHDLWSTVADSLVAGPEARGLRDAALRWLEERGDVEAMGTLAARLGDAGALGRAAVRLVLTRLSAFPLALAEHWLDRWPPTPAPERDLLALALAHRRRVSGPDPASLDDVVDRLTATGCRERTIAALALAAVVAEAHGDLGRLLALASRARALPGALDQPTLALLVAGVDAARSAAAGDYRAALAELGRPLPGMAVGERPEGVNRFHWHLLVLAGRAAEAAELADTWTGGAAGIDPLASVARWLDGDPAAIAAEPTDPLARGYDGLGDRARFDRAAFVAVIAGSLGRTATLDEAAAVMGGSGVVPLAATHAALLAGVRAAQRVAHHDEEGATRLLAELDEDLTGRSPEERRAADAHLRRSPAVPYVCRPELRAVWDASPSGPAEARARAVARALVDARARADLRPGSPPPAGAGTDAARTAVSAGTDAARTAVSAGTDAARTAVSAGTDAARTAVSAGTVLTALPLPWAVELAARAAAAGADWGLDVARLAAEHAGAGLAAELDRLGREPDGALRAGVAAVRAGLRLAPRHTVRIEVLGPLQVRRDGRLAGEGGVRRARVRALLTLLAVEGTVARDVVLDRLWPDLDPERARANLRVTLTHLHTVLEPGRGRGEPPTIVQADASHLRLAPGPGLEVDLHEVRAHLAAGGRARTAGDESRRREHLAEAVARWRGRPLPDLDGVTDGAGAADEITRVLLDAVLTLGELQLVAGEPEPAASCARRALAADPFTERAHRLAIAAHGQAHDAAAARAAIDVLDKAMSELGVPPGEATVRLVRQTARRFGWPPPTWR